MKKTRDHISRTVSLSLRINKAAFLFTSRTGISLSELTRRALNEYISRRLMANSHLRKCECMLHQGPLFEYVEGKWSNGEIYLMDWLGYTCIAKATIYNKNEKEEKRFTGLLILRKGNKSWLINSLVGAIEVMLDSEVDRMKGSLVRIALENNCKVSKDIYKPKDGELLPSDIGEVTNCVEATVKKKLTKKM